MLVHPAGGKPHNRLGARLARRHHMNPTPLSGSSEAVANVLPRLRSYLRVELRKGNSYGSSRGGPCSEVEKGFICIVHFAGDNEENHPRDVAPASGRSSISAIKASDAPSIHTIPAFATPRFRISAPASAACSSLSNEGLEPDVRAYFTLPNSTR